MPKIQTKLRWCAWNRDEMNLIGHDIADGDFDSLPEVMIWVGEQLADGQGHEYEVGMGRFSRKAEGFVPANNGEVIVIDARGVAFDEDED